MMRKLCLLCYPFPVQRTTPHWNMCPILKSSSFHLYPRNVNLFINARLVPLPHQPSDGWKREDFVQASRHVNIFSLPIFRLSSVNKVHVFEIIRALPTPVIQRYLVKMRWGNFKCGAYGGRGQKGCRLVYNPYRKASNIFMRIGPSWGHWHLPRFRRACRIHSPREFGIQEVIISRFCHHWEIIKIN